MDHKKSEFPQLLRLYRKRCLDGASNSVSQEKVSEELGYALSTYGQWERGLRSPKTRQDLLNVVNIFRRYGGIKTAEEADKLLTALGFATLQAKESTGVGLAAAALLPPPQPYHSLPSVLLYQVDHFCLAGFYLHGRMASHTSQLQLNTRSLLGQVLQTEFETLWQSSRRLALL